MSWAGGALEFLQYAGCGLLATGIVLAIVALVAYHRAPDLRNDHRGRS